MATVVHTISNSGSMAMVAKILNLMMTTILKYWPEDKEYMKAIANRERDVCVAEHRGPQSQ